MTGPIVYVDTSDVRDGRLAELRAAMADLAAFVEENEPALPGYCVYLSEDGARMTVVHMHRDRASLERHMEVAGPLFPRFADLVDLRRIDVYGDPGQDLVERLREKARLLGAGTVEVHGLHAGFARLPSG